jgi:hypothetical protein
MPNAFRIGRLVAGGGVTNGVVTLITPESNATGVVLRSGHVSATGGTVALCADKVAPASYAAMVRPVFSVSSSAGVTMSQVLPYPMYVDPGFGVYLAGQNTGGSGLVTFDLVNGLENA